MMIGECIAQPVPRRATITRYGQRGQVSHDIDYYDNQLRCLFLASGSGFLVCGVPCAFGSDSQSID